MIYKLLFSDIKIIKKHFLWIYGMALFIMFFNINTMNYKFPLMYFTIYCFLLLFENSYMYSYKNNNNNSLLYKVIPVKDSEVVITKYILGLINLIIAYFISFISLSIIVTFTKNKVLINSLELSLAITILNLMFSSLILPVHIYGKNFFLGFLSYMFMGGVIGGLSSSSYNLGKVGKFVVSTINTFGNRKDIVILIIIVATVILYGLSYLIALNLYKRRYIN